MYIQLEAAVGEYLTLLSNLFSKSHLKPKHHHLIHYPRVLRLVGPLNRISSMRYEAKHQFGKNVAHISRNRINVCRTIAIKHQYLLNVRSRKQTIRRPLFDRGSIVEKRCERNNKIMLKTTPWICFLGQHISENSIVLQPALKMVLHL